MSIKPQVSIVLDRALRFALVAISFVKGMDSVFSYNSFEPGDLELPKFGVFSCANHYNRNRESKNKPANKALLLKVPVTL